MAKHAIKLFHGTGRNDGTRNVRSHATLVRYHRLGPYYTMHFLYFALFFRAKQMKCTCITNKMILYIPIYSTYITFSSCMKIKYIHCAKLDF